MIVGSLGLLATSQASAQTVQTAEPGSTAPATSPGTGAQVVPTTGADGAPTGSSGQATAVQEVVVTGSRIPQPGLTSISPLTVVNSQELKLEGTTNVESLINNLPQAFAEQTSSVSNGSTGIATVNLRNLGSVRTLVLIDGKRLMPGDPVQPVADLNNIPAALVQRVEISTGGASAIYGSDAVAGVVNFIMQRDFQGVRFDVQGGFAQHENGNNSSVDGAISAFNTAHPTNGITVPGNVTDARTFDVSAIFGVNAPDGKGNVTAYATYRNLAPVYQNSRSTSACGISTVPSGKTDLAGNNIYDTHVCQGSSNSAFGRFINTALPGQPINPGAATGHLSDNPNGSQTFVPYTGALAFNFGPYNAIQRQDDRYTGGYFAHYAVNAMADLYSDFMFSDDHTFAVIAPSGLFQGTGALGAGVNGSSTFAINCNNPLLSASEATALCGTNAGSATALSNVTAGYRFASGAPRTDDLRHTDYKIDIGSRGQLASGWSYDAYLQYGIAIFNENYQNDVSVSRVQNALLVNPATGKCEVGGACVPLNLFQLGGLTSQQLAYVETPGFQSGSTTEQVADASITGDLGQYGIRSPFATDGVGLNFGGEYRREALTLKTDSEFSSGDLSGQGTAVLPTSGSFDVYELFGEIRVPLVQDKPFVKNLSFEGAYRNSHYSTAGQTDTYEAQLTYAVDRNVSFRGGYNRAVRAPNVNELFAPRELNLTGLNDPCSGATPQASLAACMNSGVTAAQYGAISPCPSSQCTRQVGGNAALAPEKADTITAGLVLSPTMSYLRGFTFTADVFDIRIKNVITTGFGGAAAELSQCLATGSSQFCDLIHRDGSGQLFGAQGYVIDPQVNAGKLKTQGLDLEGNYRLKPSDHHFGNFSIPDIGVFNLNSVSTYTFDLQNQPVRGGGSYDCAGLYGVTCGTPTPRFRAQTRLSWTTPYPVTLSVRWRYIGGTQFDGNSSNGFLTEGVTNTADNRIVAYNYFDFSGLWHIKDGLTFRAGVNNIADRDPPVVDSNVFPAAGPPYGNGNTYPGVYDSLGRTFFFGLTADF